MQYRVEAGAGSLIKKQYKTQSLLKALWYLWKIEIDYRSIAWKQLTIQ